MILYVYYGGVRIGLVEDIYSLQWLSLYQDAGEAKLVCAASPKNRELLQDGNRLYCTDHAESAIIREVEITDDGKDAKMTVRAVFSLERWADRVVMATEAIGNAEAGILRIAETHRRGLPGTTAAAKGLPAVSNTQVTWGSVLDAAKNIAKTAGYGLKETFDPVTAVDTLEVYAGTDRSAGAAYNGYFGDDIGNLSNYKLVVGSAGWKNRAIVGGAGEGAARKIVLVTIGDPTAEELREMWVDAKDISTKYQIATPDGNGGYTYTDGVYTDAEYTAMLDARGREKLKENLQRVEVGATLSQSIMQYGKDYFLGDIVPIKITKYGLRMTARIASVRTIYEQGKKRVEAVLSDFMLQ